MKVPHRVPAEVVRRVAAGGLREHPPGLPLQLQLLGARVHQVPRPHSYATQEQPKAHLHRHAQPTQRLYCAGTAEATRRHPLPRRGPQGLQQRPQAESQGHQGQHQGRAHRHPDHMRREDKGSEPHRPAQRRVLRQRD